MGLDTAIEWAHDTVNPWWGCQKVSEACKNCYAEAWDARFGGNHWGSGAERLLRVEKAIAELKRIERRAKKEGQPRRVFIASMADVFEDRPDLVEPRLKLWEALHALSGWVVPLILTKRPDVMAAWAKEHGWPKHAWAGYTVESQKRADWGIPYLLHVPASVRFLSMEPLLEMVDLTAAGEQYENGGNGAEWAAELWACPSCGGTGYFQTDPYIAGCMKCWGNGIGIGWVIAGGESGRNARPSHPDWFRALRDQCEAAGVPFLFKQWGAWVPHGQRPRDENAPIRDQVRIDFTADLFADRLGKKAAGRLLDGVEHNGVPDVPVPE